jgi:hypothetical protein
VPFILSVFRCADEARVCSLFVFQLTRTRLVCILRRRSLLSTPFAHAQYPNLLTLLLSQPPPPITRSLSLSLSLSSTTTITSRCLCCCWCQCFQVRLLHLSSIIVALILVVLTRSTLAFVRFVRMPLSQPNLLSFSFFQPYSP